MRKFLIGISPAIFIFGIFAWLYLLKEPVSFAPAWRVGQTWKLQVFSRRSGGHNESFYHNIWRFKVADKKVVGGRVVYTLKATEEKNKTGLSYLFKLEYPNIVLRALYVYRDGKMQRTEKPTSTVFFLDRQAPSLIPLDFSPLPTFGVPRLDKGKPLTYRQSKVVGAASQLAEFSQEMLAERPIRKMEVLTAVNVRGEGKLENLQLWEEGKPWWAGARRLRNGIKESEAILVQW